MAPSIITAPISAAFSPFITGPLLLALFNGPDRIRQPLLDVLKDYAPTAITTLKYLFAIGLTSRINSFLNRLSLNRWHLTKPGAPWTFSTSGGRGEIILITGGCSGFGLTMTQLFTKRAPNAKLVIIDRSPLPSELSSTPNLSYYNVDLTDTSALMATTETIKKEVGDVTVLINNAGIGLPIKHILEIDLKQVEKVFGVNTFSQIPLIQAFLPAMLKAKKGHIVTFASMASFVYVAGVSDYSASKAATNTFHETLTYELSDRPSIYPNGHCINTSIVHPTWAATGLTQQQSGTQHWMKEFDTITTKEEVAGRVVDQVLAGRSGPIYCPRSMGWVAYAKLLPGWGQELLRLQARLGRSTS